MPRGLDFFFFFPAHTSGENFPQSAMSAGSGHVASPLPGFQDPLISIAKRPVR